VASGPAAATGPVSLTRMAARVPRIDQFVPSLARHDAIGNHVLALARLLREAGYDSDIFYEHVDPALAAGARPYRECDPRPDPGRLILYHASTHSDMTGWLIRAAAAGQAVVVDYHNITPACYFAGWEPRAARSMEQGRRQLAQLAPWVRAAVADSEYNAAELCDFGIAGAQACPVLVDLDQYHAPPDPRAVAVLEGGPRWLFVGRIAPNKCQHDVIAAFALYRRLAAPDARLALVGGPTSPRYLAALRQMVDDLGLAGAVELPGSLPFPTLLAHFARADVFVCLSEHEGFCVPIIEAMELGVPVVAHAAAAVTETVAGAGLLLDGKDPLTVAVAVDRLLSDPAEAARLVAEGRRRAGELALPATAQRWRETLSSLIP
jgi:glycosyltransferase involved in cell wall biosynthesis